LKKGEDYYLLGKIKLQNDPTNLKSIQELARQARKLGKYEETIELCMQLIHFSKANPDSEAYTQQKYLSNATPLSEAYMNIASSYLMLDRYDEALSASQKAMEFNPTLKEFVQTYANCEIIAGSVDKASAALHELLKTTPGYPPALLLVAVVFCIQGQFEKMQELFKMLLNKRFEITQALNTMARQLGIQGKNNEVLSILNATIENRIANQETMNLLEMLQKQCKAKNKTEDQQDLPSSSPISRPPVLTHLLPVGSNK
jgi:tetratricopeptide (TPR) repeat protein